MVLGTVAVTANHRALLGGLIPASHPGHPTQQWLLGSFQVEFHWKRKDFFFSGLLSQQNNLPFYKKAQFPIDK